MTLNAIRVILTAAACLTISGCNLVLRPASGNLPPEALVKTAAAQTLSAGGSGVLPAESVQDTPRPARPSDTPTLPLPTLTPTATLTATHEKVTITVSRNTNCRTGPDKFFDLVGVMKKGEVAEAIGRNEQKTYWVIKLPSDAAKTCWLWYEWATVNGDGDALPVIQSPPTPTWSPKPDFSFSYVGLASCPAPKIIRLQIVNTGNMPWESYRTHTQDMVSSAEMNFSSDQFLDSSDPMCMAVASISAIGPGETAYGIGLVIDPASSGHTIAVELHLYTQNLGTGMHMSGNFNFTMP